ncbi:CheR family methyltransferase [Hydrogenimonas thermophila]|uniref:Chemotaxis protein methyltransferase CheR n=1 Tax=Hydrogenimonas thermophila TaxID=223786 RepID=A0A1I5PEN9_9BACT|nr:CheR family methyltransferase [Hydrogenimonas thermophila]SFP32453.1 chemotaxis protein methyltransferase CheR [Hydrogenimonas thermophila]
MFDFLFTKKSNDVIEEKRKIKDINDFTPIFNHLYTELGINDLYKRPILYERLGSIARRYEVESAEEFIEMFKNSYSFYEEVIDAVTVNETYFFREIDSLEWLVEWISNENRDVKILSIPSSNGAEIYSILIMLDILNSQLLHKVKCVGIDVNNESIKKAKKGIYSERELHKLDERLKEKYFEKIENGYEIKSFLRSNTEFIDDNIFALSSDKYGSFDIVLSRNLFIYFDDLHRKKATETLLKMLKPGGYLVMGVTDRLYEISNLKKVSSFIYQKQKGVDSGKL